MNQVEYLIRNLKNYLGVKTEKEVARALGMHSGSLSKCKSRNVIPFKKLSVFAKKNEMKIDDFLNSDFIERKDKIHYQRRILKKEISEIVDIIEELDEDSLPVIERFLIFLSGENKKKRTYKSKIK